MELNTLLLFVILALFAEFFGTVGGFGSSLFFIPIASYFLDFHSVLGITAVFHVSSNISKIAVFRHGFDKKLILYLGIPATLFVILGAWLSQFSSTKWLEISMGIFLILIALLFFWKPNLQLKPNKRNAVFGGIISGFIAGIIGSGGAIRGVVLNSFHLKMQVFIATSAIIDLAIDLSRSIVYYSNGYVHKHDLYLIPILLVVSILGTILGKMALKRISEDRFRFLVQFLILLTGIITLSKFL